MLDQSAGLFDFEEEVNGIGATLDCRYVNVVEAQLLQVLVKVLLLDLGLWFPLLVQDARTFIDSS